MVVRCSEWQNKSSLFANKSHIQPHTQYADSPIHQLHRRGFLSTFNCKFTSKCSFQGNSYYGLSVTVRVYQALPRVASHDSNRPSESNMLTYNIRVSCKWHFQTDLLLYYISYWNMQYIMDECGFMHMHKRCHGDAIQLNE